MERILFWIVVGVVAGALTKRIIPGGGPAGVIGDLMIGVMGALACGWLFDAFLGHSYSGWICSTLVAFLGAVVLLFIERAATGRRTLA